MSKIEILAPCGNKECLNAAIFCGADAVYLGAKKFSARDSANNFDFDELRETVNFCRIRGVKVYVTVNTLIKDSEIEELKDLLKFLCELAVDAVIVQDLGVMFLAKELCPNLEIHASTQMSLASNSAVKFAYEQSVKRVVLARELSLKEIREIDSTKVETEVFVHGALCMSVSGRCYFSAMLGSRSANRGRCAQVCRLPFKANGGTGNDLSLKDLSITKHINDLANIGVCSAKIEGRMKRPEYVAAAVTAAVQTRDNGECEPWINEALNAVFSRSGFTDGYYKGKKGKDMFGIRTKEDVKKADSSLYGKIHELYKNERQVIALSGEIEVKMGEPVMLSLWDNFGNKAELSSDLLVSEAINRMLTDIILKDKIGKMGGTPYYLTNLKVKLENNCSFPLSALNELKRKAIEIISEKRSIKPAIPFKDKRFHSTVIKMVKTMKLRAQFRSIEQIPDDVSMLQMIYLPLECDFNKVKKVRAAAVMPEIVFGSEEKVKKRVKKLIDSGVGDFICPNPYALRIVKELGGKIHAAYSVNVTNSFALANLEGYEVMSTEASIELTVKEINQLNTDMPLGVSVYGRQTLMLTRNCPIKNGYTNCNNCNGSGVLVDRMGEKFPVMCSSFSGISKYSEVLNSTVLSLSDKLKDFTNADFGILRFTVENKVEIQKILNEFVEGKKPEYKHTKGLYYRGII